MDSAVESLLAGPRGRRLCLRIAMALDEQIFQLAVTLGHDMDDQGSFRILSDIDGPEAGLPSSSGLPPIHREESPTEGRVSDPTAIDAIPGQTPHRAQLSNDTPRPSAREQSDNTTAPSGTSSPGALEKLNTALETVDLPPLTQESLMEALLDSVDSARYWQEPEGRDALAALPALRTGLERVAAHVCRSPLTQWWRRPVQPDQWFSQFLYDDAGPRTEPPSPRDSIVAWVRETMASNAHGDEDRMSSDLTDNWSGQWWSISSGPLQTTGLLPSGEPVALVLAEDTMGESEAIVTPVRAAGRIAEIHSADDWVGLCQDYPLDVTASRRHDWYRVTGRDGAWVIPHWERVGEQWDAVHLSVAGYLHAATRALAVAPGLATMIAGWNPDMTLWLTDVVVAEPMEHQVRWERADHGAPWRRAPRR